MIGKILEGSITDAQVEAVAAGLAQVHVVAADAPAMPDLDEVLAELENQRAQGLLSDRVAGPVRYRAAADGGIEQVSPLGVRRGRFADGAFVPDPR